MCCGISSNMPGSQSAGVALTTSLATAALVKDNAIKATMAIATVWISIVNSFCENDNNKKKECVLVILNDMGNT